MKIYSPNRLPDKFESWMCVRTSDLANTEMAKLMRYPCNIFAQFLDSTPKMQVIKRNQKDNAFALCIGFTNAAYGWIRNNVTG